MKRIFILRAFVLIFCLHATSLFAHQPNQLSYTFDVQETKPTLSIHFTPKTILDILEFLKPELKTESKINLNVYKKDLRDYFGRQILLDGNHLQGKLEIHKINLTAHDAFITFILDASFNISNGFEISINSVTDIYSKLENYVFIKHSESMSRYQLSGEQRTVVWKNPNGENNKQSMLAHIQPLRAVFLGFMVLSLLALFFNRKWIIQWYFRATSP